MQTKLTLRLDDALIAKAKAHAASHGRSVSELVAEFFTALASRQTPAIASDNWMDALDPATRQLLGIAAPTAGAPLPEVDDYYAHLARKHA